MILKIKFVDILRAVLFRETGNESWIGFSPDGNSYHIVSPVDNQIAKGVMACNCPTDGTPFGGYSRWVYFRIPPIESPENNQEIAKRDWARKISEELVDQLRRFGIKAIVEATKLNHVETKIAPVKVRLTCSDCEHRWNKIVDCLRDPTLHLIGYRACVEDFSKGLFVFAHCCGGAVHIPVRHFVRKSHIAKNLVGFPACPGFCYYEHSFQECAAECEGSCYRRIATRIFKRRSFS